MMGQHGADGPAWRPAGTSGRKTGLRVDDYRPVNGDHLCSVWTDPLTDRRTAHRFLASATEGQEALWVQDRLRAAGAFPGEDPSTISARFAYYSTDDVHVAGGCFDSERMRQFWADKAAEAAGRRASHVRAVAEMAWALRGLPGTDETPVFESSLNPHLAPLPMSVLCQYGSTRFSAESLLAMLLCHPLVMIGEDVHRNPFYLIHEHFPERFATVRNDPVGSLLPIWMHFLEQQDSAADLAGFLCNSLPTLVPAVRVWVMLAGLSKPLALDSESDAVEPIDSQLFGLKTLDRRGRLFTIWPDSHLVVGGAVQVGIIDNLGVLDVAYQNDAGRIIVARRGAFSARETARFATMASAVGRALASLNG